MASNVKFFRGKNVAIRLYQGGRPINVVSKNWDVEENAAEINDGVSGEQRDRLDKVINHYSATLDLYQTDQEMMEKLQEALGADDSQGLALNQSMAVQISHRDGTKAAYLCKGCVFGPWKMTNSSTTEAVMLQLKVRFTEYVKIPSL